MKKANSNKGITLIALAITIVVVMILAGVVISQLTNKNIIDQAKQAKTMHEGAEANETKIVNEVTDMAKTELNDISGVVEGTHSEWIVSSNGTLTEYRGVVKDTITIPNVVDGIQIKKIENSSGEGGGILRGATGGMYNQIIKRVIISNGIKEIGFRTFEAVLSLEEVTIPSSVTIIGEQAFGDCIKLKSVTIPNGVTTIGATAFGSCKALTSVTIPNSVINIGASAFGSCTALTSIKVDNKQSAVTVGSGWNGTATVTWLRNI